MLCHGLAKSYSNIVNIKIDFPSGFETIGCFKDTSNRAIQPLEGKDSILDGSYGARKNAIAKCAVAAMRKGYKMFAVQHGGWCAASDTADQTFDKYGRSAACESDGEGGPWANQVYVIKGKMSREVSIKCTKNKMRCFLVEKRPNELGRKTSVYFIFIEH